MFGITAEQAFVVLREAELLCPPEQVEADLDRLAAAIAALLAQGREPHSDNPLSAIHRAQDYTWRSLEAGYRAGGGQLLPHRLFWAVTAGDRS